jgi:hypothetical protein
MLVIPSYPCCIEEANNNVPWEDCCYAHLQLLFTCYLCPNGGRPPKNKIYSCCPDDLLYHLVFFSTFEELKLPISLLMESAGVTRLYKPSQESQLHACMWLHWQLPIWWAEFQ